MGSEHLRLRVAGAQIPVVRDVGQNLATIHRVIDYAIAEGADVLLTPEGSLSGYTHEIDIEATTAALGEVTDRARAAGLALALGTCFVEPEDGRCYNQIRFYEGDGTYLGFHSKTLTCGSMTDPSKGEINQYAVGPLRTFVLKDVSVGGLICNDLWANPCCTPIPDPHLTQELASMGARVIFHAVNGGRNGSDYARDVIWPFHETNLRMRARAGKLWIVTVDNCHPTDIPCSAPSGVVRPDGSWAVKAEPIGERFYTFSIDIGGSSCEKKEA